MDTPLPDAEDLVYRSGDIEIAYTKSGVTGREYVLIHGIGMGRRVFNQVARELGKTGTVYAMDLPGFGDSPEPGSAHDMPETGAIIARFIRGLGVADPVVVGHSMGTEVAVEAVIADPALTDRLVLIAPTVNDAERTAPRQAMRMLQDMALESPRVLAVGMSQYVKTGPLWFARKLRFMLDHRLEDRVGLVHARTLVLRGETDRVCPRPWVQKIAALLPDAVYEEIPGRGHEALIRSPQPVASLILDFVAAQPPHSR